MVPIDDRILFYLGETASWSGPDPDPVGTVGYDVPILLDKPTYKDRYREIHPNTMYPIDVGRYLNLTSKALYIQCGDHMYDGTYPVLVKCRKEGAVGGGVIANLNSARHFGPVAELGGDTPWEDKISTMAWRGADTGGEPRLQFVKRFYKNYNVGFSQYVQDGPYSSDYLAGHMSIPTLLRYKYLPVVPGNDKSSSLGWVMASGSVPLMPRPRIHSWVCEPWMKAGVHYVQCEDDWSDLEDKIKWCQNNDAQCQTIAENGKKFMLQFNNSSVEKYIEQSMVNIIGSRKIY